MKRMMFCGIALMFTASIATAEEGRSLRSLMVPAPFGQSNSGSLPALSPVPDPAFSVPPQPSVQVVPMTYQMVPTPDAGTNSPVIGQPVNLFSDVRYRAVRNVAPLRFRRLSKSPIPATNRHAARIASLSRCVCHPATQNA